MNYLYIRSKKMRMHSKILYDAPEASGDLQAEMPGLLCLSDTENASIEDYEEENYVW